MAMIMWPGPLCAPNVVQSMQHGVRDVSDLHLVDAEEGAARGDLRDHARERLGRLAAARSFGGRRLRMRIGRLELRQGRRREDVALSPDADEALEVGAEPLTRGC